MKRKTYNDYKYSVAVDFDGTVTAEDNYLKLNAKPEQMHVRAGLKDLLVFIKNTGGAVILWTCRDSYDLGDALYYLYKHDLLQYIDLINDNLYSENGFKNCRKVHATYYVDNRNITVRDNLDLKEYIAILRGELDIKCYKKPCTEHMDTETNGLTLDNEYILEDLLEFLCNHWRNNFGYSLVSRELAEAYGRFVELYEADREH